MLGLDSAPGKSRVIADAALGNFADRKAGARGSAATIRRCFRGAPHIMGRSELRARAAPDVATVRLAYAPNVSRVECNDASDALRNDISCCMSDFVHHWEMQLHLMEGPATECEMCLPSTGQQASP